MKRNLFFLTLLLIVSLSACNTPQTATNVVLPAPTQTSTPLEQAVVSLATSTPLPTSTRQTAKATPTPEATLAQVPPLHTGGWQRVSDEWLPFSFEIPDNWNVPEGGRLYWIPAGSPPEDGPKTFGVNLVMDPTAPDSDVLPGNSAVQSRSEIEVNHFRYSMIQVKVFNGPNGAESAYETYVLVPVQGANRIFAFYVSAPSAQGRTALNEILLHALQTIVFNS